MAGGSRATIQVRDYGIDLAATETSPINIPSYQIDAANLAAWLTGWGDLKTAIDGIIAGVQAKELVVIYDTILSGAIPASPYAQRELKILLSYQGADTDRVFRLEIPTPDLTALTLGANDSIVLADGDVMAAFVTAFEAVARAPDDDAETVTVVGARLVGRNI